jgi:light-regulated signal transduction histidine kinase (bacteriophytochrome)
MMHAKPIANSIDTVMQGTGAQLILDAPLGRNTGSPIKLHQLIKNLLSNAIKYRSTERPLSILIATEKPDGQIVALKIRDNGIGFEPSRAEQLFRLFNRLENDRANGYGIGLATCKWICECHTWHPDASGEPDGGAEFTIHFDQSKAHDRRRAA